VTVTPGASGTVTFFDNGTQIGTATLSTSARGNQANFQTLSLRPGTHTITATYNGDGTFASSTSATLTETIAPSKTWAQMPQAQLTTDYASAAVRGMRDQMYDESEAECRPVLDTPNFQPLLDAANADGSITACVFLDGADYSNSSPPLPVCDADYIFIGQVTNFQPFLSASHTDVYSEVYINVVQNTQVYKTSSNAIVAPPGVNFVTTLNDGTLVLPSGQIVQSLYSGSNSPLQPGQFDSDNVYLFFAKFAPDTSDVGFVKTWKLRNWTTQRVNGTVAAVNQDDLISAQAGTSPYANGPTSKLLNDLQSELNAGCPAQ
jgi:hypothetical protein